MCLLLDMCEEEGMKKGISLARKVIRLDASGKKADEIARELNVELSVVKEILE